MAELHVQEDGEGNDDRPSSEIHDYDGDHNTLSNELSSIDKAIESAKKRIEEQTTLEPLAIKIQGKSIVGKTFTDILIYVCDLFIKAIEDETIRLVDSSRKQKVLKKLNYNYEVLMTIKDKFDPEYPALHQEQKHEFIQYVPLAILLRRANKIAKVIKSIWQPFLRRWSPSKMEILLSLYDRITTVVWGINSIDHDCRSFCELITDIQQLRLCLESVDTILQGLLKSNLVLCVTLGAGAVICAVLGAVLIPTPAVAATLPLLITGGVLAWQSSVHLCLAVFTDKVIAPAVDQSKENGKYKGQGLLKKVKPPKVKDSQQRQQVECITQEQDDMLPW